MESLYFTYEIITVVMQKKKIQSIFVEVELTKETWHIKI